MVLIVLLHAASIVCCNWSLHGEKEGDIFKNINEQLLACNLEVCEYKTAVYGNGLCPLIDPCHA